MGLALFNAALDDQDRSINEAVLTIVTSVPDESTILHIARRLERLAFATSKQYYYIQLEKDNDNASEHAHLN
jgi:hypothetical protein